MRFPAAIACAALILASGFLVAAAQDSVTVRGVDPFDWRKLPQKTVEGIAGASPCGWLIVDTGDVHLIFHSGRQFEYRAPPGMHFVNFRPCLNYEGFRIRVTYTAASGNGYDGDFRILQVLAAVSPGKGDDVPQFRLGFDPTTKLVVPKPESRWIPPLKPWAVADGIVTEVACSGQNLTIVLDHSGFTLKLRTGNYRAMPFYALAGAARNGFNPCRELRGRSVTVEYALVNDKFYDGTLASIEIEE